MPSRTIALHGTVPKLKEADAKRLAAYVQQGGKVLAKSPLQGDGSFRVNLARAAASAKSTFALTLAIAPAGLAEQLQQLPNLSQVTLNREQLEKAEKEYRVPTEKLQISEAVISIWWRWCRQYCISGTVIGPHGCPVPGAAVTVYSVGYTGYGYSKYPQVTVTTGPDGTFTACFEWCSCPYFFCCWPCWPIWWYCWPWWWEYDILHIIEAIERQPRIPAPGPVESVTAGLNLIRPEGRALVRGQGFPQARTGAFAPDAARTALVKNKLSQADIRAVFPYWWWCCDDPNVIFSVNQGGNVILNEDPATDTRWCFEDGSTVTLIGNQQAIEACPGGPPIEAGFAWTRVGYVTVDQIIQGYTDWWGSDSVDAAFADTLDIYGGFAPGTTVSYYQVEAGQWSGDPARGGTAPSSASPISAALYNYVFVYDSTATLVFSGWIQMGPFNQGSLVNLYATEDARQNLPPPPGLAALGAFPTIPPGGFALWAYVGRKVYADSSVLVGGVPNGSVDLTLVGYDSAFNPVTLTPDAPLTLTIDNTPLTTAKVNSVRAFCQSGADAPFSGTVDCPTYTPGTTGYVKIDVTVSDANGHLGGYYVDAEYGHGAAAAVSPPGTRGYISNPLICSGTDPNYAQKSWVGCEEIMTFPGTTLGGVTPPDCCYEFRIRAFKRVTDGYSPPSFADYDFQTVGLTFSTPPC
jgi:hypothetical protein